MLSPLATAGEEFRVICTFYTDTNVRVKVVINMSACQSYQLGSKFRYAGPRLTARHQNPPHLYLLPSDITDSGLPGLLADRSFR